MVCRATFFAPHTAQSGSRRSSMHYSTYTILYILEVVRLSRIQLAQPFLGRSCQNKLMRSNNFEVNVPVTMCIEVEALAKNYYGCEPILKFSLHGQQA